MSSGIPSWLRALDRGLLDVTGRLALPALRVALAIVFLWFGGLKVAGQSPVEDLVAAAFPFLPKDVAVRGLGAIEIVLGLGLLTGWAVRLWLPVFLAQMVGTFVLLVIMPERAFRGGNPLRITLEGEFVVKNLVLLTAGLVIGAAIPRADRAKSLGEMLTDKPREGR